MNKRLFDKFKNYDCNKKCSNCGKECEQCSNNPFANEAQNIKNTINMQTNEKINIELNINRLEKEKNEYLKDSIEYINLKKEVNELQNNKKTTNINMLNEKMIDLKNKLHNNKLEEEKLNKNKVHEEINVDLREKIKKLEIEKNIHVKVILNNSKISKLKLKHEYILNRIEKYTNSENKKKTFDKLTEEKRLSDERLLKYECSRNDLINENEKLIIRNTNLEQLIKEQIATKEKYEIDKNLLNDKIKQMEILSKYIKIVSTDGIPSILIVRFMKNIEERANMILSQIVKFSVVMVNHAIVDNGKKKKHATDSNEVELEKTLKGKLLSMYKMENGKMYPYESCSGFEEFILNIAIRIGIAENALFNNPNFFVIDEGMFSRCDQKNLLKTGCIFEILKKKYDFILLISHDMTVKGFCDGPHLYIDKDDKGISHISNV